MRAIPREKASHLEPYQRSAINIVFSAIGHQKEGQVGAFEKMYKNLNEGQERKNERRIYRTAMQSFEQSEASLLAQSVSPHAPVGVSAAIRAATDSTVIPRLVGTAVSVSRWHLYYASLGRAPFIASMVGVCVC